MGNEKNKVPQNTEKLKEIPKWARRYAESRTAPLVVFSSIFIVLFGAVSLSVYCFLKGQFIFAAIMMILYLAVPVTGLITGLVAYIYSRYALKKLKTAAHLQEDTNEQ